MAKKIKNLFVVSIVRLAILIVFLLLLIFPLTTIFAIPLYIVYLIYIDHRIIDHDALKEKLEKRRGKAKGFARVVLFILTDYRLPLLISTTVLGVSGSILIYKQIKKSKKSEKYGAITQLAL